VVEESSWTGKLCLLDDFFLDLKKKGHIVQFSKMVVQWPPKSFQSGHYRGYTKCSKEWKRRKGSAYEHT